MKLKINSELLNRSLKKLNIVPLQETAANFSLFILYKSGLKFIDDNFLPTIAVTLHVIVTTTIILLMRLLKAGFSS